MRTTFYYLAVSNASNQKMVGQIDVADEEAARKELNQIGLSILLLDTKPIAQTSTETEDSSASTLPFDFEAKDKNGKIVNGTIDAEDRLKAYNRLLDEFGFEVFYLCEKSANPTEKKQAREEGVSVLKQMRREQMANEAVQKNGLMGSLGNLMKRKEEPASAENDTTPPPKLIKRKLTISDPPEKEASKFQPVAPIAGTSTSEQMESGESSTRTFTPKNITSEQKNVVDVEASSVQNAPASKTDSTQTIISFRFLLTELIAPPFEKTRAEIWLEFQKYFKQKQTNQITGLHLKKLLDHIHGATIAEHFWALVKNLLGTLAIVFWLGFALALFAQRYAWGEISTLAETLARTTLLPFLAFTFLILYLATNARAHFVNQRAVRTSLLFALTTFVIVFTAANFLY